MYHGTGHLNSEPFYEKANPHDLNTELVRYSDPHFILLPFLLIKKLLCNNFNKFSKLNNFVSFYHKNLSQVPTMFLTIWIFFSNYRNHIREDFDAFENAPDTGLLSKSVARFIKYIINYVIKGVGGTALLVVTMTLSCLCASFASLVIAILSPGKISEKSRKKFSFSLGLMLPVSLVPRTT